MENNKITFEEFYDGNYMKLFFYLNRKINNRAQAEDLAQNVFMYCYENFDNYDPSKSSYTTWLYVVANSRLKNYYRDKKSFADYDLLENVISSDSISEVEQAIYLESVKIHIAEALELLPVKQKEAVVRKYFLNQSHSEIADYLGISPANSRVLLSRAIAKLGELLQEKV